MVPPLIARVVGVKSYISSYSWFESVIHHKKIKKKNRRQLIWYKPYKSKKYMRRTILGWVVAGMDFTALVCWVLDPCLSCLKNCSRRCRTFGSRCEIIALILCGLPISHPRPYGTSLLFKTSFRPADLVYSAWRIVLEGFWTFGSRWAKSLH